jgi:hypothetical protein
MLYLLSYFSEKAVVEKIKSWLGTQIKKDQEKPLIVSTRHDPNALNQLTKKEVIAYAHARGIAINSRKKKEELIEIILRS